MDTNIQQIIKERYNELPADIQQAIKSSNLADKFKKIADKHGLMLDQNGALQTETLLVMLGLEPTESYINNIRGALEIPSSKASDIANDVNTEILDSIKDSLRKIQEEQEVNVDESASTTPENLPTAPTISAIEQAGQFTVESQPASHSEQYNDTSTITKEAVLNKIEEDHIPLVDHLLTTPVSNPQKVEVKKPYTVDPYREQM